MEHVRIPTQKHDKYENTRCRLMCVLLCFLVFLGACFRPIGALLAILGRSGIGFGHFWVAPFRSWAALGRSWASLGRSGAHFGRPRPPLGCSWPLLAGSWPLLGRGLNPESLTPEWVLVLVLVVLVVVLVVLAVVSSL